MSRRGVMRSVGLALGLALASAALGGCDDAEKETPAVAAAKADCKQLLAHIYRISPQSQAEFTGLAEPAAAERAAAMVATLPPEDIEQCVAAEPEIVACMHGAPDVAAIKKCIPPDEVIACMQRAKKHPDVRKQCAANPKAADGIKDAE